MAALISRSTTWYVWMSNQLGVSLMLNHLCPPNLKTSKLQVDDVRSRSEDERGIYRFEKLKEDQQII